MVKKIKQHTDFSILLVLLTKKDRLHKRKRPLSELKNKINFYLNLNPLYIQYGCGLSLQFAHQVLDRHV